MSLHIIYNVETGELICMSDTPKSISGHPLQTKVLSLDYPVDLNKYEWIPNVVDFVLKPSRIVTKLQYMNLFTDTELATIYSVAKTQVSIEVWLEKFKLATEVDLTDPQTIGGLNALEQFGLIGEGRAAEILNG